MFQFDQEASSERVGDGSWAITLSDRWNIGDKPNGGYLMAVLLRAMRDELRHRADDPASAPQDPLTLTAHFLRPGSPAASAEVTVDVLRRGRSISTVRGTLAQGGTSRVEMMAGFGVLADSGHPADPSAPAIDLEWPGFPPPEACVDRTQLSQGVTEMSLMGRVEVRIPPDRAAPELGGDARIGGWIRFRDQRPPDTIAAALFVDAFPPSLFSRFGSVGWVPTLEMTVQVRRRPADGWLCATFETDDLVDGRMVETGSLWDQTGALVARSRQLGLLLS